MRRLVLAIVAVLSLAAPAAAQVEADASKLYLWSGGSPRVVVSTGSGAPSAGTNGDTYIDFTNHEIYIKHAGVWSLIPRVDAANVFTASQTIAGTEAIQYFDETDAALNTKWWRWNASAGTLLLQTLPDSLASATTIATITRAGGLAIADDLAINTSKFTVDGATGNTVLTGTLTVDAPGNASIKIDRGSSTDVTGLSWQTAGVNDYIAGTRLYDGGTDLQIGTATTKIVSIASTGVTIAGALSLTGTGTLGLSGLITSTASGVNSFIASTATEQSIRVRNTNTGTTALAGFYLGNSASNTAGGIVHTSTGFTATGAIPQNGLYIYSDRGGGVSIADTSGTGDVRIYSRNALAATFGASQALTLTGALSGTTGSFSSTVNATTGYKVNGAAAAGTILRGDGTNYVTSTLTVPNAATANRVVYATGSNAWGESGNLTFDGSTLAVTGAATISATLGVTGTATFGANVNPLTGYVSNLGSLSTKYLQLHAAELVVETLVAQNTAATIGGRVLVAPTNQLTADRTAQLATPSAPTVTPQGATGATTYSYKVTALDADGETLASTAGTTATGNATLTVSNFNRVTWSAVTNAVNYRVYGRTGGSELLLTTTAALTYDDTGAVTPSGALPGANTTATTLTVKYNNFANADQPYMEASGKVEFLLVNQWAIVTVSTGSKQFTVSGDQTAKFAVARTFLVAGSTGNDGTYTVTARSYNSGTNRTTITVSETVPSGTADGGITYVNAGATGYLYTVTRNRDASGSNDWYAGDAAVNTGTTGDGVLDLYSDAGLLSGSGPTIVGNVRTGTAYNALAPRWAIGNLNGLYSYGADTYGVAMGDSTATNITIDATNGFRIRNGTTNKLVADTSGNLSLTGDLAMSTAGAFHIGATAYATGVGIWMDYNGGSPRFRVGDPAGGQMTVSGSTLTIGGWTVSGAKLSTAGIGLDTVNGITLTGSTSFDASRAIVFNGATRLWGDSTGAATFRLTNVTSAGGSITITNDSTGAVDSTFTLADAGGLAVATLIATNGITLTATGGTGITLTGPVSASSTLLVTGAATLSSTSAFADVGTMSKTLAANTSGDGWVLQNPGTASSGNQRYSPRLRLSGVGWKTNATAAGQVVDFAFENRPVQGAANPSGLLAIQAQINGGGYTDMLTLTSAGKLTATAGVYSTYLEVNQSGGASLVLNNTDALVPTTGNIFWYKDGTLKFQLGSTSPVSESDSQIVLSSSTAALMQWGASTIRTFLSADTTSYTQTNANLLAGNNTEALGVAGSTTLTNINAYIKGVAQRKVALQTAVGGADGGELRFFVKKSGDADVTQTAYIGNAGEWVFGSPSGIQTGYGKVNGVAFYDDGVLLTDWIFDDAYGGQVKAPTDMAVPPTAPRRTRTQRLFSITETRTTTEIEHRLPWMPTAAEFDTERMLGGMTTRLWQGQEQQQLYLFQLLDRITALEQQLAAIKAGR